MGAYAMATIIAADLPDWEDGAAERVALHYAMQVSSRFSI